MALLEALPETVENSLRDLRKHAEDSSNGGSSTPKTLPAKPTSPPSEKQVSTNGHEAKTEEIATTEKPSEGEVEAIAEATEPPRIAFATDIKSDGAFGPEWVVVENAQVYVFAENGGDRAHLRRTVPIRDIKEVKAEMHIGNGQLEARTAVETIPLVRFSQAEVAEAHAVARQITALAKGEEVKQEQIEGKKHCPRCKRILAPDTDVCPGCVNKRAVMIRLLRFLAPFKKQAIASVVVLLGMTAFELAPPYIGGRIIDVLIRGERATTLNP